MSLKIASFYLFTRVPNNIGQMGNHLEKSLRVQTGEQACPCSLTNGILHTDTDQFNIYHLDIPKSNSGIIENPNRIGPVQKFRVEIVKRESATYVSVFWFPVFSGMQHFRHWRVSFWEKGDKSEIA